MNYLQCFTISLFMVDSSDTDDGDVSTPFSQLSVTYSRSKGTRPTSRSGLRRGKSNQDLKEAGYKRTTIPQFLQLYDAEPDTIAGELQHDLKSFQKVVLNSERVVEKKDMIKIIVILYKLTRVDSEEKGNATRILAEAFNLRSSHFCFKLQRYVRAMTISNEIKIVIALFEATLKLMPSCWDFLPIEDLKNAITTHAPSLTSDVTYLSMISIYQDLQKAPVSKDRVVDSAKAADYSEYRSISILPSTSEINEMLPPKLHANIVEGHYDSWEHYYDTQFKLLKEDFVAPLRRGVCGFRDGLRGRDISDVRVYYNVIFTGLIFSADGIVLSVQFDSSKMHRVNWEHSKRLIYGSLLCFSCNNFEAVMFASVVDRDAKKLKEGKLTVKMESSSDILSLALSENDYYTMIESQAHYETYYHILRSLQKAEFEIMPFTEILIESKCSIVQPPQYMCLSEDTRISHPQLVFDMKDALGMADRHNHLHPVLQNRLHSFDVSKPECWPKIDQVQLDESQLKAMKMALTQKVSVIQGPPGTGKTYIGMKIVQALLTNRNIWDPAKNSPLLVVCYTNHALDQFLEGIIDLSHSEDDDSHKFSIVRIGGRCQNEKVAKFSIKNFELRKPKVPREVHFATRDIKERIQRIGTNLDRYFKIIQQKVKPPLHELIEFIAPLHLFQICSQVSGFDVQYIPTNDIIVHGMKLWLSCRDIEEREKREALQASMKANGKSGNSATGNSAKGNGSGSSDSESDGGDEPAATSGDVLQEISMEPKEITPPNIAAELGDSAKGNGSESSDSKSVGGEETNATSGDVFQETSMESKEITPPTVSTEVTDHDAINQVLKQKMLAEKTTNDTQGNPEISNDATNSSEAELGTEDKSTTMSDGEGVENTINVVGEAEIAEAHRMVDQPATIFEYKDSSNSDDVEMPKAETSLPTDTFMFFPKGPFSYSTVSLIDDVFRLSKFDRWRLYDYWKEQYIEKLCNQLRARFEEYLVQCKEYKTAKQEEDFNVLEKVDLIGMTTTGAAKYQHIIQRVKPKIVVVEEAAEVMECHIVSCLTAATQQLILIGDHKQLRPNPNEYYLAQKYNLDISLFERLIRSGIPHATLQIQHRMRPEIAGLVCPYIYPTLFNHESVLKYENIRGVTTNMYFFDHQYPEAENDDLRSHSNAEEAKLVVALCDYFLKQGYSSSQITVLTTYTGQLLKLKPLMPRNKFEGVRITAVDNFQGEENDIIILSLVRSNDNGRVGFLKIENRICVALSRAKKGFYCFGNFTLLKDSCDTWKNVLQYLDSKHKLGSSLLLCCSNHPDVKTEIHTVDDFKNVPEGGCNKKCDARLDCGHVCKMYCHPRDPFHEDYECKQPCARKCDNGHVCPKLCYETCSACRVKVPKVIPGCGHIQTVMCHVDPAHFSCKAPCSKKCAQGHLCSKLCSEYCGECLTVVEKEQPKCGHRQNAYCYEDPALCECHHPCERSCHTNPSNPHRCKKLCYLPCGDCKEKVVKILPQCSHKQLVACYRDPQTHTCQAPCERKLRCGHPCTNECGEPCTTSCMIEVPKEFHNCNHTTIQPCSMSIDKVFCQEKVHRKLPCGHSTFMKCSKSVENFKCKTKIKIRLKCGHGFEGNCGKQNEKCDVLTVKTMPKCGHKIKLPCYESLPPVCDVKCTTKLLCGHQCTGTCSECFEGRMHKACPFQMFPLPCGHRTKEPCSSLMFPVCDYKCEYSCVHRKVCTHNCSQRCNPCKEPCSWICPHYECSKKCHEICDRPRCNHPCRNTLPCKHPCIGVCGEPCPRVCRICKGQKKKFKNLCVGNPDTRSETRYIQLSCDHLFEVTRLDQLLDGQLKDSRAVGPLVCPSCRKQIRCSHRYGDLIKQKRGTIERLHTTVSGNIASKKQQDSFIENVLSVFVPSRLHLLLKGFQEGPVSVLKRNSKLLPPMFEKLPTLLSKSCTNKTLSILENEISQYVMIKEHESLYKDHPELLTSLQQLIEFFKATPPSAQKTQDISCERQRLYQLYIISSLEMMVVPPNKDHSVLMQLKDVLVFNQPKLTLSNVSTYFDELQNVARRARVRRFIEVDSKSLKSAKVDFINGVWTVCTNGHIYCEPRGMSGMNKELWGCPDCPH